MPSHAETALGKIEAFASFLCAVISSVCLIPTHAGASGGVINLTSPLTSVSVTVQVILCSI